MIQELLQNYWQEFLIIASAHALAVASPGPDFAIVMRQSLVFGRKFAVITSIGIGLAILVHVGYAVLGVGLLIQSTPWLFKAIQIMGGLYLVYIGWQALGSAKSGEQNIDQSGAQEMTASKAFRQGFITNVLNPKATLFFLSLFTTIVGKQTPIGVLIIYGVWMCLATMAWFAFLSYILSSQKVRSWFANYGHWIDRLFGVFLIGFALFLFYSSIYQ